MSENPYVSPTSRLQPDPTSSSTRGRSPTSAPERGSGRSFGSRTDAAWSTGPCAREGARPWPRGAERLEAEGFPDVFARRPEVRGRRGLADPPGASSGTGRRPSGHPCRPGRLEPSLLVQRARHMADHRSDHRVARPTILIAPHRPTG